MQPMSRPSIPAFAALLAAFWVGSTGAVAADDTQRAEDVLGGFKRSLKQALVEGLAQGPVAAVEACHLEAPDLASTASKQGVRVGRASHLLRNPANAAPAWVQPLLDAYAADPASRAPRTVAIDSGRTGYVEPIYVEPLCLTCHGSSLAPEVAARIEALYPDDAATGYEVGDLRGVFWVELPAGE